MTTISIVTPVRNGAATLARTLDSVAALAGSVPGVNVIQHIIIDGLSTDDTVSVVQNWWAAHPESPLEIIREADLGIYDAMNKGIQRARGEWIGIINADDWYAPDALRHYQSYFSENAILHGQQNVADHRFPHGRIVGTNNYNAAKDFRPMRQMAGQHPTCFVPRAVYENVGLFQTSFRLAGDFEFLLRAHQRGVAFRYVPHVIAHFSKGGISDQQTARAWREVMAAQIMHGRAPFSALLDYCSKPLKYNFKRFKHAWRRYFSR